MNSTRLTEFHSHLPNVWFMAYVLPATSLCIFLWEKIAYTSCY